jgi:hypothetical protein
MLSKETGEKFTSKKTVVLMDNICETVYPHQTVEEVIEYKFGLWRGQEYQIAEMIEERAVVMFAPAGTSELVSEASRLIGSPTFNIIKTLKWTGKQFKQI